MGFPRIAWQEIFGFIYFYKLVFDHALEVLNPSGFMAFEIGFDQKDALLKDVISFKNIKDYPADLSLIAYENTKMTLDDLEIELKHSINKTVNVIVGAEGGLSKDEVNYAISLNYKEISLGKRILRSETACVYILSLLSFYMDR